MSALRRVPTARTTGRCLSSAHCAGEGKILELSEGAVLSRLFHQALQADNLVDAETVQGLMKQKNIPTTQTELENLIRVALSHQKFARVAHYVQSMHSQGMPLRKELVNDMIEGYCVAGAPDLAVTTFYQAQKGGITLNLRTFELLMQTLRQQEQWEGILALWPVMSENGINPSALTFEYILLAHMKLRKTREVSSVLKDMTSARLFPSQTLQVQLLWHFVQLGMLSEASWGTQ